MNATYLNATADSATAVDETPAVDATVESTAQSKSKRRLKYGTGIKVKRVVLVDGVPAGRGRPTRGTIKNRTYVYIPVDATYDADIYGVGTAYNAYRGNAPIKTVKRETYLATYPKAVDVIA